jgi:hypothetical protein
VLEAAPAGRVLALRKDLRRQSYAGTYEPGVGPTRSPAKSSIMLFAHRNRLAIEFARTTLSLHTLGLRVPPQLQWHRDVHQIRNTFSPWYSERDG